MGQGDAVWSFSATRTRCGRKELRAGYIFVHEDMMGAYIQTVCKVVDEGLEEKAVLVDNTISDKV
jgi:hypothetical protein